MLCGAELESVSYPYPSRPRGRSAVGFPYIVEETLSSPHRPVCPVASLAFICRYRDRDNEQIARGATSRTTQNVYTVKCSRGSSIVVRGVPTIRPVCVNLMCVKVASERIGAVGGLAGSA